VPPSRPTDAPCTAEGPVDESGPVGHGLMSAERSEIGDPFMGTQVHAASSSRSGASLRTLLPDSPQEIGDTRAQEDTAQVPDPEAEAYANVGASISLPDLAVGAATNVGAPTSPADLEAVATANVGVTLGLGQTTRHTQSSKSSIGIGRAFGGEPAPVTYGFPLPPSLTHNTSIPISELPEHMARQNPPRILHQITPVTFKFDRIHPIRPSFIVAFATHSCNCAVLPLRDIALISWLLVRTPFGILYTFVITTSNL